MLHANSEKDFTFLRGWASGKGYKQVLTALSVARIAHHGTTRKSGEDYLSHPLKVACYLIGLGVVDENIIVAAILHDVMEDCPSFGDVHLRNRGISDRSLHIMHLLTKTDGYNEKEYYGNIALDDGACIVKIADRCHNLATMARGFNPQKMRSYIEETEEHIYPLCKTIKEFFPAYYGVANSMKFFLESMCNLGKCNK